TEAIFSASQPSGRQGFQKLFTRGTENVPRAPHSRPGAGPIFWVSQRRNGNQAGPEVQITNNNRIPNTTMSNSIPYNPDNLEVGANRAESGARTHGVAVRLKQNTADEIERDKEAVFGRPQDPQNPDPNAPIGKRAEYAQARSAAADARAGLRVALSAGREFCIHATNVLKKHLGRSWNAKWHGAGFVC